MEIKKIEKIDPEMEVEALAGTGEWYYGMHMWVTMDDVLEALHNGEELEGTRLYLIHYPEGTVYEPLPQKDLFYMGQPVWDQGRIGILAVDGKRKQVQIYQFQPDTGQVSVVMEMPLKRLSEDTWNLKIQTSPLMLTCHKGVKEYEILWPESKTISVTEAENLICREGERLYFSWSAYESYDEKVIVRNVNTGKKIEEYHGELHLMPDGNWWLI